MVIRSLVAAVLFAGAASASAGPVVSNPVVGLTLNAGSVSVVGALDSIEAIVAAGNWEAFAQAWSMHTTVGTSSAMLFSPNAKPVALAAAPVIVAGGATGGGGAAGTLPSGGGSASTGGLASGGGSAGGSTGSTGSTGGSAGGSISADILPDAGIGAGGSAGGTSPQLVLPAADVVAVPEPGSIALLLAGLAGATVVRRRRPR
ncbi:MAG: PEP-CTERM sorting domain-containing protein [Telluria sp.]